MTQIRKFEEVSPVPDPGRRAPVEGQLFSPEAARPNSIFISIFLINSVTKIALYHLYQW